MISKMCQRQGLWGALPGLGFLLAGPAMAEINCSSPEFLSHIEDPSFQCQEASRETLPQFGGITLRTLLHKGDLNATISQEAVTEKVRTALAFMEEIPAGLPLKIDNVTIVLMGKDASNAGDTGTKRVLGIATRFQGECILQLYPSRIIGEANSVADALSTTSAHELFHCVQHATWPALLAGFETRAWVIEGTAETVSQAIFPSIPSGFQNAFDFSDQFHTRPLTQITYPNIVFFSWLWNQSPSRMFDVLSVIPGKGDETAQQAALLTVVPEADLSQFVRDFLDGQIQTPAGPGAEGAPGGIPLLMTTNIGGITVDAPGTREVVSTPFTMFALDVMFSGGSYEVAFQNLGPIEWRHRQMQPGTASADLVPQGDWGTGGFTTESDCFANDSRRLAGMAFAEAKLRLTMKATGEGGAEDCTSCGPTAARDQCLIGTWVIDNTRMGLSLAEYLSGTTITGTAVKGANGIRFDKEGHSQWGYDNFMIGVQEGIPGSPAIGALLSGRIDQGWSASRGHLNTCLVSADARITLFVEGAVGDTVSFDELPKQSFERYRYDCNPDGTLILEQRLDGTPFLMRLHRVD